MVTSSTKHRSRCFFDITVNGTLAGRIIFELFTDSCPLTCENFRALCTGEKGLGKTTEKPLHYKGTPMHRVVKDFIIQGGDFSAGNGTGGESVYGGTFSDENFDLKHDKSYLLSMANRGKDTNGSQFFITTKPAPHLDGIHTVFGQVLQGVEVVQEIENQRVDNKSRPTTDVRVSNCGELILKIKTKEPKQKKKVASSDDESSSEESTSSSSSESEDEKAKKRKKKREKEMKNSKREEVAKVEKKPSTFQSELASHVSINPEQIPDVPTNSFLLRRSPEKNIGNQRMPRMNPVRTKSGRKVKGRGLMRYRTPSQSRSRSTTPPHWRAEERKYMAADRWQPPGRGNSSLEAKWERGADLQPASGENKRGNLQSRTQLDRPADRPNRGSRDNGLGRQRGREFGQVERPTRAGMEGVDRDRGRQVQGRRDGENVAADVKTDRGKEKEKGKKHKKDKDKSHKKHKKHKKHSDKEKAKLHKGDAMDRKRAPSPKARSRSPLARKNRGRSPGRGRDAGVDSRRRHSSPSPRDGRRNASNREMGLKTNNKVRKSKSLSPPPSRWKPGQKPWKSSDDKQESGMMRVHHKSPAEHRIPALRSPSSSPASSDARRSPSPIQLRRHGPNQSPSPRHLSPQHDHSPSRSPPPKSARQAWPTSPSERVKLATLASSSSPIDKERSGKDKPSQPSSSSGEDSSDEESSDGERKLTTGDPYSTKNRKKYQKATEQRKRSPTLKERFKWQPPSEDEAEAGALIVAAEGREEISPEKVTQEDKSVKNVERTQEKFSSSSENNGTEDDDAGLKLLEKQRTDLEERLAALTSQNRKIQEMMGGPTASEEGNYEEPSDKKAVAHSPSRPQSTEMQVSSGSQGIPSQTKKSPSPDRRRSPRESGPSSVLKEQRSGDRDERPSRKRGYSNSSRSRSPPKRRARSRSTSRSPQPRREKRASRSVSPQRRSARSPRRSPRRSPKRPSSSAVKVQRGSPRRSPKASRRQSRSSSGSKSPQRSPRRVSRRSRTPRRSPRRVPPRSPVRKSRKSRSSSSSRSRSPSVRKRPARRSYSSDRGKSRSRSRGRHTRDIRRRSPSRERRRPSPRRPSPRRPSPRRRRRSRSPSYRRRSRSVSRSRRSRSPLRRRRSPVRSRSRDRGRKSPPRRDRNRRTRRSYSRSSSRSSSSRSRSRSAPRRRSRSYSRSSSRSSYSSRN